MAITICLDFLMFPDNTPFNLQPPVTLASFNFAFNSPGAAGMMTSFVNESGGGKGLQFPDQGIRITLPAPASTVSLKLGQFASPIRITLFAPAGATVGTAVTNWPNLYKTRTFNLRTKASVVELKGGNNEGILAAICATM